MSETGNVVTPTPAGTFVGPATTNTTNAPAKDAETAPVDLNAEVEKWKALARKNEQTAKSNADAARKLAEIEQRDMSEAEKAQARIVEAETRAVTAERQLMAARIATEHGIAEFADLLHGDEAAMAVQAKRLAEKLAPVTSKQLDLGHRGDSVPPGGAPNRQFDPNDWFRNKVSRRQ